MLGLLLAAGRGGRFDPSAQSSKLLSPMGRVSCFEQSLQRLRDTVTQCYCVLPPVQALGAAHANPAHVGRMLAIAQGLQVTALHAPHASRGMGESLAWAAATLAHRYRHESHGLLVHLADMPWVSEQTLHQIAQACDDDLCVVAPICDGQRGNPVAFGARIWPQFAALRGDQGARRWIDQAQQAGQLRLIESADKSVLRDLDTQADLPSPHGH